MGGGSSAQRAEEQDQNGGFHGASPGTNQNFEVRDATRNNSNNNSNNNNSNNNNNNNNNNNRTITITIIIIILIFQ